MNDNDYLEVVNIRGNVFENYPPVTKGYLFHFSASESIIHTNHFYFSIEYHWKHTFFGSFEKLKKAMEDIKEQLLLKKHILYENTDMFSYVHLFITESENKQYQLLITSDTFDISKIIDLDFK